MGRAEVQTFLTHLAVEKHIAASTQNQALSALLFLYRRVLDRELDLSQDSLDNLRAKKDKRLPTVLTRDETLRVIGGMKGVHQLMAKLLYGSGLRLMECIRLRVKDLDFGQHQIIVRETKGDHDRVTMLPDSLVAPLKQHLFDVRRFAQPGFRARSRCRLPARCSGAQVPQRQSRMGAGSSFSPPTGARPTHALEALIAITRTKAVCKKPCGKRPAPPASPSPSAAHIPSLVRHTSSAGQLRYPHRPRTPRPQGRQDHDDLHPHPQSRWTRRP